MKSKLLFIVALTSSFLVQSCRQPGCTDSKAINFDEYAEKEDGSCLFNADAIFYWTENTSDWFLARGTYNIKLDIDGRSEGVKGTYMYDQIDPDCDFYQGDGFKIQFSMGDKAIKTINYKVLDFESSEELITGSFKIYADECNKVLISPNGSSI